MAGCRNSQGGAYQLLQLPPRRNHLPGTRDTRRHKTRSQSHIKSSDMGAKGLGARAAQAEKTAKILDASTMRPFLATFIAQAGEPSLASGDSNWHVVNRLASNRDFSERGWVGGGALREASFSDAPTHYFRFLHSTISLASPRPPAPKLKQKPAPGGSALRVLFHCTPLALRSPSGLTARRRSFSSPLLCHAGRRTRRAPRSVRPAAPQTC